MYVGFFVLKPPLLQHVILYTIALSGELAEIFSEPYLTESSSCSRGQTCFVSIHECVVGQQSFLDEGVFALASLQQLLFCSHNQHFFILFLSFVTS